MLGQKDIPQTISTSYADDEQTGAFYVLLNALLYAHRHLTTVPPSFAKRVCADFAQLGA